MVKPALPYLDIIAHATELAPNHPLACYQVSGEFAMIHAGAKAGVYDLKTMAFESVESMVRAGMLFPRNLVTQLILHHQVLALSCPTLLLIFWIGLQLDRISIRCGIIEYVTLFDYDDPIKIKLKIIIRPAWLEQATSRCFNHYSLALFQLS